MEHSMRDYSFTLESYKSPSRTAYPRQTIPAENGVYVRVLSRSKCIIATLICIISMSIVIAFFGYVFYQQSKDDDTERINNNNALINCSMKSHHIPSVATTMTSVNGTINNELFNNKNHHHNHHEYYKSLENDTITLNDYIHGTFFPNNFEADWISDDQLIYYDKFNNLCIKNVSSGNETIIIDEKTIKLFQLKGRSLSRDRKYLLSAFPKISQYRYSTIAKYKIFDIKNEIEHRLFPDENREAFLQYAEWGSNGSQIVYVYKNNIYYKQSALNKSIKLTTSGVEGIIYNGIPDWVYEEEIINGPKMFWMSPDGKFLIYSTIDDTHVEMMSWPIYGPYKNAFGHVNQYPLLGTVRYPKPGHNNPIVHLWILSLPKFVSNHSGDTDFKLPLKPPTEIESKGDHYLISVKWINPKDVLIVWMSRAQNYSVIAIYKSVNFWAAQKHIELKSPYGWIDLFKPPLITSDGKSYIIRFQGSNKDDNNLNGYFLRAVKVDIKTKQMKYLTYGPYDVSQLLTVDSQNRKLYFIAANVNDTGQRHLMSVTIDSGDDHEELCHSCPDKDNNNNNCLYNHVIFSNLGSHYIFICNGPSIPKVDVRNTLNHTSMVILEDNHKLKLKLQDISLPKRILIKVPISNGFQADVSLYVPHDFDENCTHHKYPVIFDVYGGPGSNSGSVTLSYFYNEFGAAVASEGIIYAKIDTRGSLNHGCDYLFGLYRKFGQSEVEDTIDIARYFRDNLTFIDSDAIGIWGWSYGGFVATKSLIDDHDDPVFDCGVAVAPVSDWLYYDSVYTERFMGFPTKDDNLINYGRASVIEGVSHLKHKKFFLIFGTADDNVHAQNSMMLVKALNEEKIPFEMHVFPDKSHSLEGAHSYLYTKINNFFKKCFRKQK